MEKLFIIDAVNFLFRAYYAIGPLTNLEGESTNALYGFIRSINKIIKDFSPTHLVAVFDGPENKKSRTEIYKEYKSHRKGMPEDLPAQLEKALQYCEIAGIPFLSIPGVEADDTIGSITHWAEKKHVDIFICSSDKDLCQLVNEHVFIINVHKENLLIDRKKVKELYGVTPEQITDYLGLIGDASDNIPGLEGFGPKTAASLLEQFGNLEHILAHPEKVSGQKKQDTLIQGKEIALMSKQLATIHLHVEFPRSDEFFLLKDPQVDALKAFFQNMHFMTLLKELEIPPAAVPKEERKKEKEEKEVHYTLIDDEQSLIELLDLLKKQKEICLDTETTDLRPMHARIVGMGFAFQSALAWYVPFNGKLGRKKVLDHLKPFLEHSNTRFFGHNLKYDMHALQNEGISLSSIVFDTILASYLISPQKQKHGLDELSLEKFGKVKVPIEDLIGKGKKQISMSEVPLDKICHYCCEDVDYTCRLKELFEKELEQLDLHYVFKEIELPLIPVLLSMERRGIFIDEQFLKKMSHDINEQTNLLENKIFALAGEPFNLNSPKQLSKILFEKMGIKPPKKTQTGFSTSAEVLESLQETAPIVKEILNYRVLEKLRSTYIDALPQEIFPQTGRVHCTFNQSVTATGRLSCQNPNLQNIPIRSKEGKKIREAFKPQQSGWSFLSLDYSQIELRLLAHLCEDPSLLKAFNEGEDIHTFTASLVFNVPLKEVTSDMRYRAKAVNFGILYGQQAFGLSQGLAIEFKEAVTFIETYFQRYKKVKDFLEFCKEGVRKTGRAVTMTGRQRPIPEILSKNPVIRAAAERLAINTPLQGTAADLIKLAMIDAKKLLNKHLEWGHMLLQVHDELIFESPDEHVDVLSKEVKKIMEHVMTLKVPLSVEISIGKNWGEC